MHHPSLYIITDEPIQERPFRFIGQHRAEIIEAYEERDFTLTKAGDVLSPPYTPDTGSKIRFTFDEAGICCNVEILIGKS